MVRFPIVPSADFEGLKAHMKLALYSGAFVVNLVGLIAAAYNHEPVWVAALFPLALFWFAAAAGCDTSDTKGDVDWIR